MEVEQMKNQELQTLGMALVTIGIVFGTERIVGYPLIGAGVLLSIISATKSKKKSERSDGKVR
jgi:prolipoprotein diacylglyceryltransferase